jgi:hypothetical protein
VVTHLLADRDMLLNIQEIGSDLLNPTLTDLLAQAAAGSSAKVISATGGYEADVCAVLMNNAFKAVSDNGVLTLRPAEGGPSGLLCEQFSLPVLEFAIRDKPTKAAAPPEYRRIDHKDSQVEVDGISKELILGLTWHQDAAPSVDATSPSGAVFTPGVGGAYRIVVGWMSALPISNPEPGTWRVRVTGAPVPGREHQPHGARDQSRLRSLGLRRALCPGQTGHDQDHRKTPPRGQTGAG